MSDMTILTSDEIWRIKEDIEEELHEFLRGQCDKHQVKGMMVLHSALVTCLEQILAPAVMKGTPEALENHTRFIQDIIDAVIGGAKDGCEELSKLH